MSPHVKHPDGIQCTSFFRLFVVCEDIFCDGRFNKLNPLPTPDCQPHKKKEAHPCFNASLSVWHIVDSLWAKRCVDWTNEWMCGWMNEGVNEWMNEFQGGVQRLAFPSLMVKGLGILPKSFLLPWGQPSLQTSVSEICTNSSYIVICLRLLFLLNFLLWKFPTYTKVERIIISPSAFLTPPLDWHTEIKS